MALIADMDMVEVLVGRALVGSASASSAANDGRYQM
jgi:hypothetical protein